MTLKCKECGQETIKVGYYCYGCKELGIFDDQTVNKAARSCEETFGWAHAMVLVGEGAAVQVKEEPDWVDIDLQKLKCLTLYPTSMYRRKPTNEKEECEDGKHLLSEDELRKRITKDIFAHLKRENERLIPKTMKTENTNNPEKFCVHCEEYHTKSEPCKITQTITGTDKTFKDIPQESETFDWLTSMRLFADGVEIQRCDDDGWNDMCSNWEDLFFNKYMRYRRKPKPLAPDWSKDQGFKEGDLVMGSVDGQIEWKCIEYNFYAKDSKTHISKDNYMWNYARSLTKSEASRVRVEP